MITIGVIEQNVYDNQHASKYYAENKANFVNCGLRVRRSDWLISVTASEIFIWGL